VGLPSLVINSMAAIADLVPARVMGSSDRTWPPFTCWLKMDKIKSTDQWCYAGMVDEVWLERFAGDRFTAIIAA
jgi:hypothetical protein